MDGVLHDRKVAGSPVPVAALRPRLLVFETPSADALVPLLRQLFPEHTALLQTGWEQPKLSHPDGVLPVWHLDGWDAAVVARHGSRFLRALAYPLAIRGSSFAVSFPFAKEILKPSPLDTNGLASLDVEDILKLLGADAMPAQRFDQLHLLATQTPQTPIEERLGRELARQGLAARPQVRIGRYIVDFLVEANGHRVAVEADGHGFHNAERDAVRDRELVDELGITRVVRFTGSEIFRDAGACASYVSGLINGGPRQTTRAAPGRQPLDASQTQAVRHGSGPARVLAPAGAGKTRVLVERIAELVAAGVEPSSILALAFNRKANELLVAELQARRIPTSARSLFDDSMDGVRCATFNAFGHRYQRERLQLAFPVDQSATEWRRLMAQAVRNAGHSFQGTRRGSNPVVEFLRARERACADLADPSEIEVELQGWDGKPPIVVPYGPVDEHFERLRLGRQIQSFDDQLTTTVKALLDSPKERAFVQNYFSHVLVDEFQDLNAAQLMLVELVSRPWRKLFVVGDDDQLIYGWRYAKLTNILDFEQRMPNASTYVLSTNYRCSVAVVDASSRLIAHNTERVQKDIRPRQGAPEGTVNYVAAPTYERAQELVAFVQAQKNGLSHWREIAVLCRYKAQQPLVAIALDNAGIPRTPLLSYRLFSDRNMGFLRTYLELVRDPQRVDGPALAAIINRPNRFAPNTLVESVRSHAQPWEALCEHLDQQDGEDAFRKKALRDFCERTALLQGRLARGLSPLELVDEIVDAFGLERFWRDERSGAGKAQDEGSPLHLLEQIRLHAGEAETVEEFLVMWDARAAEEERRLGMESDVLGRERDDEADRVVISTMHASKGREYKAVVLFDYGCELGTLSSEQVEEERRVCYVGMTRAQSSLLLTIDDAKPLHRFIRESISPTSPSEETKLAERKAAASQEVREAAIDTAQATARLRRSQTKARRTARERIRRSPGAGWRTRGPGTRPRGMA